MPFSLSLRHVLIFVAISLGMGFGLAFLGIGGLSGAAISGGVAMMVTGTIVNLSGNRRTTRVGSEERAALLAQPAPAGHAALLVYREGIVGMAVGIDVGLDGRTVAQLKSPTFVRVLLAPGPHRLTAAFSTGVVRADAGGLELIARPGETLAVQLKMGMGGMRGALALTPIADVDAVRAKLATVIMVQPEASAA